MAALHSLDMRIMPGEIVAVVGESGSGKSTLALSIIGLLPPTATRSATSIAVAGHEIGTLSGHAMRHVRGRSIGLVPQDPNVSLDPVKTIGAQLAEVLTIHNVVPRPHLQERVLEMLHEIGLDQPALRARQYPHELSGGMKQRVLIAIAMACNPPLIIADEPTSGLDVTVQRRVLDRITALAAERNTAVLLITHDLGVASDRAHRMIVMQSGRIVEAGPTQDIINAAQTAYTRELLAAVPRRPTATSPRALHAPAGAAEVILQAQDLTKRFGTRRFPPGKAANASVDGVSLQLYRGRTLAIVGESGSGKTTTARMLAGLTRSTSGDIRYCGESIYRSDWFGRRDQLRADYHTLVQFVYQNPFSSLNPSWTISDIVADPLRVRRIGRPDERRQRAAELIAAVALPETVLQRRPAELSGGQLQRVAIARALALRPEILILDEPVSALDVSVQARIIDLLLQLQARFGLSYLFISHDLGVVNLIAHDVAVMQSGRIVEHGAVDAVFRHPKSPYTQALLDAIPGRMLPTHTTASAQG